MHQAGSWPFSQELAILRFQVKRNDFRVVSDKFLNFTMLMFSKQSYAFSTFLGKYDHSWVFNAVIDDRNVRTAMIGHFEFSFVFKHTAVGKHLGSMSKQRIHFLCLERQQADGPSDPIRMYYVRNQQTASSKIAGPHNLFLGVLLHRDKPWKLLDGSFVVAKGRSPYAAEYSDTCASQSSFKYCLPLMKVQRIYNHTVWDCVLLSRLIFMPYRTVIQLQPIALSVKQWKLNFLVVYVRWDLSSEDEKISNFLEKVAMLRPGAHDWMIQWKDTTSY